MIRRLSALTLTVALSLLAPACNSSYMPRSQGRVATVMQDGKINYVRDGRVYRHGFLGGGLVDAVRGNPAAEHAANTYYSRNRDGLLISLAGLVCTAASSAYLVSQLADPYGESNGDANIGLPITLMAGCMIASYGGIFYMASGRPYQFDAINIFNDGPPCRPALPPGVVIPYATASPPDSAVPPCPQGAATRTAAAP